MYPCLVDFQTFGSNPMMVPILRWAELNTLFPVPSLSSQAPLRSLTNGWLVLILVPRRGFCHGECGGFTTPVVVRDIAEELELCELLFELDELLFELDELLFELLLELLLELLELLL